MSEADVRQEPQDVRGNLLVWIGLAAIVIGAAAVGASAWMLHGRRGDMPERTAVPVAAEAADATRVEQTRITRTAPGIEANRSAQRQLHEWGWVDEQAEIATIPIDAAMEWLVEDVKRVEVQGEPGQSERSDGEPQAGEEP